MKATKFIILVGGFLGLISFFVPILSSTEYGDGRQSFSAFQIIKGLNLAQSTANAAVEHADAHIRAASASALHDGNTGIDTLKGYVMMVFVPAFLLTLIGGVAVARKKLGRLGGTFTLLIGLVGLGIASLLLLAAGETSKEGVGGGPAMYLLLLTGIAGTLGGLITLVKPDRGLATA